MLLQVKILANWIGTKLVLYFRS